ncbi:MAG: hypothetical protein ACLTTJ_08200 [Blautia sp.]
MTAILFVSMAEWKFRRWIFMGDGSHRNGSKKQEQCSRSVEGLCRKMEAVHKEVHENSGNESVEYEYSKENCILGATDILLDKMLFSIAGTGRF